METKWITWNEKALAIEALKRGGIVLFPTETVYGIACLASNKEAYGRLCEIKGRPEGKPFTLMCSSITQVVRHADIDCGVSALLKSFMPGEVTLLLKTRQGMPEWMDLGTGIIGVRVPNSPEALALIEEIGEPLLVSSANRSGDKPAINAAQAKEAFDGQADLIIEGDCVSSVPSTIVDCHEGSLKLIRQGNVAFEKMEKVYQEASFTVALGSDHGGFEYKSAIIDHLNACGFKVLDFGCPDKSSVDYPLFAHEVGKAVIQGKADLGIVVCTSGEGVCMAANKVPGIRCGIGYDDVVVGKMREHNNANVISFGQKYMELADVLRRVDIFLCETFSKEAKHHRRVKQIEE